MFFSLRALAPLGLVSVFAVACSSGAGDDAATVSEEQTAVRSAQANQATAALFQRFWNGSYFNANDPASTGRCGRDACYWIYAEAFDAVLDAVQRTHGAKFKEWVPRLYEAQAFRGFIEPQSSKYFDDENWMALALIRAYDVTREQKYLCRAVTLYRDIKSEGFDYVGGAYSAIWWNAAHTEKATASNFGPALTAARLHERSAMDSCGSAQRGFVDAATLGNDARMIFDHWLEHMTRVTTAGERQVADHRAPSCPNDVCWWDFTYNQGVGIGAALELHHITGDAAYLIFARELANYMTNHEVTAGHVLHDGGSCKDDCEAFKGIGYRFLAKLYASDTTQTEHLDVLRASAAAIWQHARSPHSTFVTQWTGPASWKTTLAADASAVMALNLAVEWGATQ